MRWWNSFLILGGMLTANYLLAAPLEEISFTETVSEMEYSEVSKPLNGTVGLVQDEEESYKTPEVSENTGLTENKKQIKIPQSGQTKPERPISTGSLIRSALPLPPVLWPKQKTKTIKQDIEPGELVIANADMTSARMLAEQLRKQGYQLKRRIVLSKLQLVMTIIRVPEGGTTEQFLSKLRRQYPELWVDYNRRYFLQGLQDENKPNRQLMNMVGWSANTDCGAGQSIGMVDTAVDSRVAEVYGRVEQKNLLTHGVKVADRKHGTAVAALLAGKSFGLLPGVTLYVAAVFRQGKNKLPANTNTELVLKALDWLTGKNVTVINFSLGGRRNLLVELGLKQVMGRGITVVAAAGNSGPGKAPIFPAAQKGVIAVTAVDINGYLYTRANTGDYLDFAAPGVDLALPSEQGVVYRSGTSFAAPFVSAAILMAIKQEKTPAGAYRKLAQQAQDQPPEGKDTQYGWGLLKTNGCGTQKR